MFKIHHRTNSAVEPFEYMDGTAGETIEVGEALTLVSGKLTKCGATVKPAYIAMGGKNHKEKIPVIRVLPTVYFEVPAKADQSTLNVGDKVTLHTDGLQVTATTTSGVFTLDAAAKAGEPCIGHFE